MSGMADETPRSEGDFLADFGEDLMGFLNGESAADTAAEAPAETMEVAEEAVDTVEGDAHEPVEDATGRLHGKDGKFVPKPGSEADTEEEAPAEEPEPQDEQEGELDDAGFVIEVDDEETAERVQAVLEKYDGDPAKALVALAEAQSLIGKKDLGQEYAQANAELEAVKAELAAIRAGQDEMMARVSRPMVPITQDLIESDPAAAAQAAVDQDNVQALEVAINAWQNGTDYVEANPEAARLFLEKLALQAQMQELAQKSAETATPAVDQQAELAAEVEKVKARHPDLEQYIPAIDKVAEAHPILKRATEIGTPLEKAQALEALIVIAKSQQGADTSREALKRVSVVVKQEADEARAKARVVSASRGSAATASQPSRVDQFLDAFDQYLGLSDDEE